MSTSSLPRTRWKKLINKHLAGLVVNLPKWRWVVSVGSWLLLVVLVVVWERAVGQVMLTWWLAWIPVSWVSWGRLVSVGVVCWLASSVWQLPFWQFFVLGWVVMQIGHQLPSYWWRLGSTLAASLVVSWLSQSWQVWYLGTVTGLLLIMVVAKTVRQYRVATHL